MRPKLVLWGASGHALTVADIVSLCGEYELTGFIEDSAYEESPGEFCGLPLFRGRLHLDRLYHDGVRFVIMAFGNCRARLDLALFAQEKGFHLAKAVHPSAVIAKGVRIGEGTVIAAGAVVNPAAIIGNNVIINTSASVDHEVLIADGVHICPGVRLAGRVRVEEAAWVGVGSSVVDRVTIGAGAFIGAGSVVVDDIPPFSLAYGVPAKVIKRIEP